MTGVASWSEMADLARRLEAAGFSGMLFTESSQTPWISIAMAAEAAPTLTFCTGIAVAFPRSPMIAAQYAWEIAGNTGGRFRLGLGSQVKAHVERRYAGDFDRPAARMRDYVLAVKASLRAFRREERLSHEGEFYSLSLLPTAWSPPQHEYGHVPVDISAVGPVMCRVAGEVADGVHVHPLHSAHYLRERLLPAVSAGAESSGRTLDDLALIVPVFAVPGDTPEERAPLLERARTQIAFYGSTPNYAYQFDDLGFTDLTPQLTAAMRAGDMAALAALVTDEVLDHFAIAAPWDEMADRLRERYEGVASRVVPYLAAESIARDPSAIARWGEIARALR
ncbi:MAG: LLM class F420-dependent oxidoreductase [Acidimicrobiaceae bacterium]|nr:LLM class F420-dependent oxidoreductase [Acidimicrobiaceae bacterium]